MKQQYRVDHAPGKYIVWDIKDKAKPKKVAIYPFNTELERGRAFTSARIRMQELNEACNIS